MQRERGAGKDGEERGRKGIEWGRYKEGKKRREVEVKNGIANN